MRDGTPFLRRGSLVKVDPFKIDASETAGAPIFVKRQHGLSVADHQSDTEERAPPPLTLGHSDDVQVILVGNRVGQYESDGFSRRGGKIGSLSRCYPW